VGEQKTTLVKGWFFYCHNLGFLTGNILQGVIKKQPENHSLQNNFPVHLLPNRSLAVCGRLRYCSCLLGCWLRGAFCLFSRCRFCIGLRLCRICIPPSPMCRPFFEFAVLPGLCRLCNVGFSTGIRLAPFSVLPPRRLAFCS